MSGDALKIYCGRAYLEKKIVDDMNIFISIDFVLFTISIIIGLTMPFVSYVGALIRFESLPTKESIARLSPSCWAIGLIKSS